MAGCPSCGGKPGLTSRFVLDRALPIVVGSSLLSIAIGDRAGHAVAEGLAAGLSCGWGQVDRTTVAFSRSRPVEALGASLSSGGVTMLLERPLYSAEKRWKQVVWETKSNVSGWSDM
jgi:hypothetical protein